MDQPDVTPSGWLGWKHQLSPLMDLPDCMCVCVRVWRACVNSSLAATNKFCASVLTPGPVLSWEKVVCWCCRPTKSKKKKKKDLKREKTNLRNYIWSVWLTSSLMLTGWSECLRLVPWENQQRPCTNDIQTWTKGRYIWSYYTLYITEEHIFLNTWFYHIYWTANLSATKLIG